MRELDEDPDLLALLRAQKPPRTWVVYAVHRMVDHDYRATGSPAHRVAATVKQLTAAALCAVCGKSPLEHRLAQEPLRAVRLLVNGPVRHLTCLGGWTHIPGERGPQDLSPAVQNWVSTLHNLASMAGVTLVWWSTYDGRG